MNKQRESNIELLRICTMLGVILLHYNNPMIGRGFNFAQDLNLIILYVLESLCVCAVDLFIMISGYFLVKTNRRTILKPIELIIQVILYSLGLYVIQLTLGYRGFELKELISRIIPANYFVILYFALYLVSPLYNLAIHNLNKKNLRNTLVILIFIFSVWPTLVDLFSEFTNREWLGLSTIGMYGSQWGYSFVNFSLMYFIGGYIQKTKEGKELDRISNKILLLGVSLSVVIMTIWSLLNDKIGYFTEKSSWEYCNPFVILTAGCLFILFLRIKIKPNKIINVLAKGAFSVFLLQNIFLTRINIEKYVTESIVLMLLHICIVSIGIYLICWIGYKIYSLIMDPIWRWIGKKLPIMNKNIYGEL